MLRKKKSTVFVEITDEEDQPSVKLKFRIVSCNFVKSFRESFNGNIFRISFIFGTFKHKAIHFIPVMVEQISKGNLVACFSFFYISVYFQCIGFEKVLVIKMFNCVKIKTISMIGNQYITSFSLSFPAANPIVIQAKI